jgi:drug/metabolite transporter (DMT)-like permease
VSVFNHLATLVSIVGGFVFLNEQLAYYHMIGAAAIIAGVLGANAGTWGRRQPALPPKVSDPMINKNG